MCFLTEVVENKLLLFLFLAMSIYITTFQRIDMVKQDLNDLKDKYDHSKGSQVESLKVLKKTVERLKDELRESEEATKKALDEIRLYKADKTGRVDYAYRGRVTPTRGTETYISEGVSFFGMSICSQNYLEGRIVEASVMPGDCWPVSGQQGSALIELIDEINVTDVSLEHAPKQLLPNGTASAPKEFSLLGLPKGETENGTPHFFGRFAYSTGLPEVQTFAVQIPSTKPFKKVEVQIHSNHGHPEFTCIYRVRIHGKPVNE